MYRYRELLPSFHLLGILEVERWEQFEGWPAAQRGRIWFVFAGGWVLFAVLKKCFPAAEKGAAGWCRVGFQQAMESPSRPARLRKRGRFERMHFVWSGPQDW